MWYASEHNYYYVTDKVAYAIWETGVATVSAYSVEAICQRCRRIDKPDETWADKALRAIQ
jgi:hypothetical protein